MVWKMFKCERYALKTSGRFLWRLLWWYFYGIKSEIVLKFCIQSVCFCIYGFCDKVVKNCWVRKPDDYPLNPPHTLSTPRILQIFTYFIDFSDTHKIQLSSNDSVYCLHTALLVTCYLLLVSCCKTLVILLQTASGAMVDRLRPDELASFREAFDTFDRNSDGTISTKVGRYVLV